MFEAMRRREFQMRATRETGGPSIGAMASAAVLAPIALAGYGALYAMRARTLARRGQPVPGWRIACFAGCLVLLLIATSLPVDDLAGERFSAHMGEHLLIGDLAPLLLVLGCSGPILAPVLGIRAVSRLRPLTHPVVAFTLWAANLYLWHLPVAYEGALEHDLVHAAQHACFFTFGALLWMPLFGPLPKPDWFGNGARLGYILVVRLTGTVLANVFLWAGAPFYAFYDRTGADALADQIAAGGIMMVEQSVVTLGLFCWLFLKTARDAEERQELAELAAAHGVELDERRIARAVAAGQGARLRERIAPKD
jgi:cytochrome c oxidase assembly factor CtaG